MKHMTLDGSSAALAIPAAKDKTLLDDMGCCPHDTSDLYVKSIQDFMAGRISWVAFINGDHRKCIACQAL